MTKTKKKTNDNQKLVRSQKDAKKMAEKFLNMTAPVEEEITAESMTLEEYDDLLERGRNADSDVVDS